jgi:hypothetical protein
MSNILDRLIMGRVIKIYTVRIFIEENLIN